MDSKNTDDLEDTDLFGNPSGHLRDPRGRKSFQPTQENRLLVMTLAAQNWTHENIAAFMGQQSESGTFDPKTLRKYFSRELELGRLMIEGMAHQVVVRKMMDGSLGAAKKVLEDLGAFVPKPLKPKPPKKEPEKGKKQVLEDSAKQPPSGWDNILGGTVN